MDSESAPNLPGRMLALRIYFDGSEECAGEYSVGPGSIDRITTEGGIERQKLCFSKLKLLESDDTQLSEDQIKSVGPDFYEVPPAVSHGVIAPPALNERSKKRRTCNLAWARCRVEVIPTHHP
ncbi:hypothetical protein BS47DRAFT_1351553 [Hydnum rufescens UP504]|uniref:Uncharacterized protein n=1 Tax=Hydnum rufescens UP504 TaxID=1448309 RepID=A0A9P6DM29_9AGAM|nr:hypothetical protein BS47DRAFT_1351553 [Hydnum rufescens UP504]